MLEKPVFYLSNIKLNILRYVHGQFLTSPLPTIAVELKTKLITLNDGTTVKAQIWDTAGMEKYKSVTCQ